MNTANFNSIYKMLDVINLNIVDSAKFIDYVEKQGKGIETTIKDIKVAKEKSIRKIDYSGFEKKLVSSFKEIQKEINKDGMFQYSDEEEVEKFRNFFQEIVDKYVVIYKLKDDKDECAIKKKEIESLKNEINSLNKSTSPLTTSDLQKINDLNFELGVKNLEYKKVLELIEEDVQIITRNSAKTNFINLLDELNSDLNQLTEMFSKLSLTPITRQIVDKMFLELNNSLTNEKNEYKKEINLFEEICESAGIENSVASLEKNDVVVYNGSRPYYGVDNSYVLKKGQTYKVKDHKFANNGLEEFYLEGFDKPFSVTLFDTPREWQEKIGNKKNKPLDTRTNEISQTPDSSSLNHILDSSNDEIKLDEKEVVDDTNKEDIEKNLLATIKENIVSNKESERSKSFNEVNDANNNLLTSGIKEGDFVVYNGNKDNISSKDNTNLLQTGFSYRVTKSVINEKGEEEIYLEGIDQPFPLMLFETEEIWKEHINRLILQMTNNIYNKPIKITPKLKQGDVVVYNGSKDYTSSKDNTNLLQTGFSYRVTKSVINEKGEEEIYLEGIDMPFSITMFEPEEIWKKHTNELEISNSQTINNSTTFVSSEEKKNRDEITSKLDSNEIDLESNSNLVPVFKQGDFVVYNGTKDFNLNRDFTNLLQTGFSYKVTKSVINEKGEEEIYLEGIDTPFSITMFETEEIWKEHMNGLILQMVHKIVHKPINKEVAYTNAVMGLNNKKVHFNLKKSIHNVLGKVKRKFESIKSTIETYRTDYESEYIANFMTELNEYENQDRDLIDIDEFSKDFDAIKNAERKSKSK